MPLSDDTIDELAAAPKRVRTVEGTVEERDMKDVIAGDIHSATKTAIEAVPWGIRMARVKPGSTTPGA
jgi:4-hydroxy-3-methylbut-2-en-1-yl diphosphate synthase IspG/GcpE